MTTPVELLITGRDESGGAFGAAQSSLSRIGEIAAGILTSQVFTKLAQGVKDFAVSIVTEAREAQLGQAQLNAVIESTGGVAGVTADQVNKLADKLQYLSKFTDDQIVAGETMMLQFTNISKDIFPAATQAAIDLAARTGTDLNSAFQVVGKALERPEEGIGRLNQAFKLFSEDELKAIQDMAASGDIAGAQAAILERLAQKVGGAAEAQVQPWENVKKKIDNIKESLGEKLLPVIDQFGTMFMDALGSPQVQAMIDKLIGWLSGELPDGFSRIMSAVTGFQIAIENGYNPVEALSSAIFNLGKGNPIFEKLSDLVLEFNDVLSYLGDWWDTNGKSISKSADQIFQGLKDAFTEISSTAGPFIADVLEKLKAWFTENGPLISATIQVIADIFTNYLIPAIVVVWNTIQPILGGIIDLILGIAKIVMQVLTGDWQGAWETAKTTVSNVFNALIQAAMNLISGLLGIFGTSVPEIAAKLRTGFEGAKQGVITAFENMRSSISSKFTEIGTTIKSKIDGMVTSIRSKISSFTAIGKAIIDGIKTGITNSWSAFVSFFKDKIDAMIQAALALLGISSPSKVFTKIGEALPQGLGVGIRSAFPDAVRSMNSGLNAVTQTVSNRTTNNSPFYNFGTVNRSSNNDMDFFEAMRA